MDRWYNTPANNVGRGENNVYSETEIQCGQKDTVCSFPNERFKEITRGDDDSNINIRKRRGRGPSSSSWCSGRLWKTEDHQRRHLTGGRRLQKQAVKGSNIVSAETQLEKDGQDVLNWSQPRGRMTKEDIIGTEIVLAMQAGPDWKSNQASEYGKVSGPVSALESGGWSLLENGDQLHDQVQGDGGGQVVAPGVVSCPS